MQPWDRRGNIHTRLWEHFSVSLSASILNVWDHKVFDTMYGHSEYTVLCHLETKLCILNYYRKRDLSAIVLLLGVVS